MNYQLTDEGIRSIPSLMSQVKAADEMARYSVQARARNELDDYYGLDFGGGLENILTLRIIPAADGIMRSCGPRACLRYTSRRSGTRDLPSQHRWKTLSLVALLEMKRR